MDGAVFCTPEAPNSCSCLMPAASWPEAGQGTKPELCFVFSFSQLCCGQMPPVHKRFEKQVYFLTLAWSSCEVQPTDHHGPSLSSGHTGGHFRADELAQPGSSR